MNQIKHLQEFRTVSSPYDIETGQAKKRLTPWIDLLGFDREVQAINVTTTWSFLYVGVQSCMTVWL